jgi:thiol-disulfide isomerase/thioredoxin
MLTGNAKKEMKIKFAKKFISRFVTFLRSKSYLADGETNIKLGFLFALTILLQLPGLNCKSQSTLEIRISNDHQPIEPFTFERVNPISGTHIIDTITRIGTGKYSLQIRNTVLPGLGMIRNGNQDLREVFTAPGFPLQIIINQDRSAQDETITGAWKELDSVFRKMSNETEDGFNSAFEFWGMPQQLRLYDQLLRRIDTAIDARHRSIKDFLLFGLMRRAIDSSEQLLVLNNHKTFYQPYLNQLSYGSFRNEIDHRYNYKLNLLTSAQLGKPAPLFKLRDTTGNTYSLENFKGKLVYIDLWASWCLPCRLETPYMHRIISRYNKRPDIVFIGVAVSDRMSDWKRALRQDKPRWLQLHDSNTFVANAYAVTSVPRYILIDKNGNVLEFNAPPPSQQAKLVAIIDKELSN